jgi:ribulose-5-phosphate 4-epimerase/fuculose-1-phosphate aldolase
VREPDAGAVTALIWAGRRVVGAGLVAGSGGNLSARLAGADECVVTSAGAWLDELDGAAFSVVGLDGRRVGGHPDPSSELAVHLAAYRARPDVTAVLHLHPQMSVLLDALGHPIRLITTDHAFYVGTLRTTPWLPPGSRQVADAVAAALADGADVVMLGHHGCVVVADTVEVAVKRAHNLEEAAVATYRALTLGDTATTVPAGYRDALAARKSTAAGTEASH